MEVGVELGLEFQIVWLYQGWLHLLKGSALVVFHGDWEEVEEECGLELLLGWMWMAEVLLEVLPLVVLFPE